MTSAGLTSPRDSVNSVSSVRSGSRHQLKRSITELASPVKLNRRKEKERDRYNEDRASHAHHVSVSHLASANPQYQGRASIDIMTRSEGVTPYMSPDQSRRQSLMLSREEETRPANTTASVEPKTSERVQEDQAKTTSQVEGLKQSLVELGTFSTSTARRLDETYYAVLQKMSTLQSTVSALKELAEESQSIHHNFEKDASEIENDITSQIAAMGQFKEHQENIESLQTRVQNGRARIRALSDRVDIVREQVELWERLDKQSQNKTRLRLRAIMICVTVVFLAVLVLFFGAQYVSRHGGFLGSEGSSTPRVAESIIESHKEAGHTALPLRRHEKSESYLKRKQARTHTRGGEELRAFDEL
ncbi:septum formation initiator domain-containing protein [Fusarium heterosporum]|uniref:Septum formation initiator domain-containing protein n=1 Tax=Fusarium heterosporum TaxID=42747 RepID=A0A8H5TI89_FUSHE|nr:septum formation initiator domain-containing protein [Fusarium heterosporum]